MPMPIADSHAPNIVSLSVGNLIPTMEKTKIAIKKIVLT